MAAEQELADVGALITQHPHFPKQGILFHDVFPILRNPDALSKMMDFFEKHIRETHKDTKIDAIVGLDARGFLVGPWLAARLGCAFVPVRKAGKLPGKCVSVEYEKEYGKDVFELQEDALSAGQNCIIIDDLLATGGTLCAAEQLITKANAQAVECLCIVELSVLKGRAKVKAPCFCLFDRAADVE